VRTSRIWRVPPRAESFWSSEAGMAAGDCGESELMV
jgi:hypothetical protein